MAGTIYVLRMSWHHLILNSISVLLSWGTWSRKKVNDLPQVCGVGKLEYESRKSGYIGTVNIQDMMREASVPISSSSSCQTQMYFVSYLWIFCEGLWYMIQPFLVELI